MELRKQISGYQTSLLTCNRKAAVKINVQIATVNARLIDCVNNALALKKTNTERVEKTDIDPSTAAAAVGGGNGNGVVKEEEVVITNSLVDRGSELLQSILANGRPLGTIEETWERIILSEKMRFTLQDLHGLENVENINAMERNKKNANNISGSSNDATSSVGETSSVSTYDDKANISLSYVSYINNNFNSVKRLAAVEKV